MARGGIQEETDELDSVESEGMEKRAGILWEDERETRWMEDLVNREVFR